MPSGLASHSLPCMCHLHMTEATDAYLSMLFFPRKRFMEMPVENTTQDEYSCQLVPQELLRASSPLLSISFSLAARNHMEILFLIRGHVWKASAKLCKIMKTYFVMRMKLVPVSLHVLFLRIKEQPGLLLHQSLINRP